MNLNLDAIAYRNRTDLRKKQENSMIYTTPNSGVINTVYVEFVSPIQMIDPTEENGLEYTVYAFFVRTMSGYTIGFEEKTYEEAAAIREDFIQYLA